MTKRVLPIHVVAACVALLAVSNADAGRFRSDDPLATDPDKIAATKPTPRALSKTLDLLTKHVSPVTPKLRATNVNTLGEVPDSSWFTNRMSREVMSIDDLRRGPNQGSVPDTTGTWTVVKAKTSGVTPGFRIRDSRGEIYFVKLDPLGWPQMTTSTEVIGTKFFHAFGYHVPENYIVHWNGEFKVDQEADVIWESGQITKLSRSYVEQLLEETPRRPDGTIQAVASKFLRGRPIGQFDFAGRRVDDANDLFEHQDRRELRGYGIFCAWMNHNDSDSANSLDMFIKTDGDLGYVQHNIIDFGTILGSGASHPKSHRAGHEYYVDLKPAFKAALTFGIWDRHWRKGQYTLYPAIGRMGHDVFDPATWKADYPNPAFDAIQLDDAFWATRTISRFSDEAIRAIVDTGQVDDPQAAEYLARQIIARRDILVRHYFSLINPLDGFTLAHDTGELWQLSFQNLGEKAALASSCTYRATWHRFDNDSEISTRLDGPYSTEMPILDVPKTNDAFLMVSIESHCDGMPAWQQPIEIYLRNGKTKSVVGIERLPDLQ